MGKRKNMSLIKAMHPAHHIVNERVMHISPVEIYDKFFTVYALHPAIYGRCYFTFCPMPDDDEKSSFTAIGTTTGDVPDNSGVLMHGTRSRVQAILRATAGTANISGYAPGVSSSLDFWWEESSTRHKWTNQSNISCKVEIFECRSKVAGDIGQSEGTLTPPAVASSAPNIAIAKDMYENTLVQFPVVDVIDDMYGQAALISQNTIEMLDKKMLCTVFDDNFPITQGFKHPGVFTKSFEVLKSVTSVLRPGESVAFRQKSMYGKIEPNAVGSNCAPFYRPVFIKVSTPMVAPTSAGSTTDLANTGGFPLPNIMYTVKTYDRVRWMNIYGDKWSKLAPPFTTASVADADKVEAYRPTLASVYTATDATTAGGFMPGLPVIQEVNVKFMETE